jgi:anaerobic selenocysteine-containing dehydrogenase
VSGKSHRLARLGETASVRMNPQDAERIGVRTGSVVLIRSEAGEARAQVIEDPEVPPSGIVIPAAGPRYIFQKLLPWPEEYCPPGWDRIFVSIVPEEEDDPPA